MLRAKKVHTGIEKCAASGGGRSRTPRARNTRANGFEDRGGHRAPSTAATALYPIAGFNLAHRGYVRKMRFKSVQAQN